MGDPQWRRLSPGARGWARLAAASLSYLDAWEKRNRQVRPSPSTVGEWRRREIRNDHDLLLRAIRFFRDECSTLELREGLREMLALLDEGGGSGTTAISSQSETLADERATNEGGSNVEAQERDEKK